ncbi:putative uncharacterized protein [Clostridium sp. CAG:452]|nr:putative uncharacterized protein [Clostridium sp. CAG:452]
MKNLKKFLIVIILIVLSILALLIGQGYKMYKEAISTMPLSQKVESIKSQKDYTSLSEIPKIYTVAVISVEDHRFEKHHGIDVIAIARAAFNDIRTMSFVEGGSTITQQLAKNMYFTQEKKITRKIAEVFMSYEIEKNYSKDEILELYVNTIYYGNNYYNIKSASLGYFDKLPKDLNSSECTMLAGIPNAPSLYNPKASSKLAKQRQKQVIQKMIKYGNLNKEDANKILDKNI